MNDFYDMFKHGDTRLERFENLKCLPSMDLVEDEKNFKVELEMPGMDEKDIKISFADNVLTIHGEKERSRKNETKNYISREINYGRYDRSITLPSSVDIEKATASFKKGMLWIILPKRKGNQGNAREIFINKA